MRWIRGRPSRPICRRSTSLHVPSSTPPRTGIMSRRGTFIPLITPLDEAGAVSGPSVARLLAHARHTASGYIPCLTSGEGWRLSPAQWEAMLRFTLAEAEGRTVIAGIERPTTDEVLDYAEAAERLG